MAVDGETQIPIPPPENVSVITTFKPVTLTLKSSTVRGFARRNICVLNLGSNPFSG